METYIASVQEQIDDFNQHACGVLRHEKKIRGWTNKHIANISGVSEDAVKYLLSTEKPPKDPRTFAMIRIAKAMGLDLNYLFGYTPPQIADTAVVTVRDDNYISELVKAHERHTEDIKVMCELRIADIKQIYEERLAEHKSLPSKISPYIEID